MSVEVERLETPGLFDVVSTEVVFAGHIVTVRVDQVVMPGGAVKAREVIGHHRAVGIVALDDENRVTLVGQYRHPFRRRLWELPAGLLDVEGEEAQAAAARELGEEVGLRADRWDVLLDLTPTPGITDESIRVYLARDLTDIGRQGEIADEEADLVIVRVPLVAAVAAAFRGEIVNGAAVAGILATQLFLLGGPTLRAGEDPWTSGPSLIRERGEELAPPPAL